VTPGRQRMSERLKAIRTSESSGGPGAPVITFQRAEPAKFGAAALLSGVPTVIELDVCSGGEHEILHAVDQLYPDSSLHGELAGAASLFTSFLQGNEAQAALIDGCLTRHGLPRTPRDLGLDEEQFAQAVLRAPSTRPDRYTILEHLDLDEEGVRGRIGAYLEAFDR